MLLLSEALHNIENSTNVVVPADQLLVSADGAYDSNDNFEQCKKKDVIPVIPIRKNFSIKTKDNNVRKEQGLLQLGNCKMNSQNIKIFDDLTEEQKKANQKQWKKDIDYGRRWTVEIAFSTFKRILGEDISARVWCNVVREIKFKVMIYNLMIDHTLQQEIKQN